MQDQPNMILAILAVHAVIAIIQWIIRRQIHLDRTGNFGIYLMLVVVGFNCFGFDFPPMLIAGMVLSGLGLLIRSVRLSVIISRGC